jgi:twinkle protein
MTLSNAAMDWLADRNLDVELCDKLGLDSARRGGTEALVLPFLRSDKIVRRKYRTLNPGEGDAKWSADKGGERIAFNENCLRRDDLIGQPLIITEGEFDCIAAIQCGFERSISVPDGAPPPGERDKAELEAGAKYAWHREIGALMGQDRVAEIIIAADGDENGAALLHDLATLLMPARCKFIRYPLAPPAAIAELGRDRLKDLNEVLQFYGQKGVVETINRAEWFEVDGVFLMSELPPPKPAAVYEIDPQRFPLLSDHYKARMGDLVVLTGFPGLGKTTFINDVCCSLADNHGLRVAFASFEQSPTRDHRRALRSWHARKPNVYMEPEERAAADRWIDEHFVFIVPKSDDDVTLDWLLARAETAVIRWGCKIVVIDPWNEMDHMRDPGETLTEYVGRSIKRLKRFAAGLGIHLIVIAHPSKPTRNQNGVVMVPSLYDISDSAHWNNKPDLGIIVHRETEDITSVKVAKSRYHDIIGKPGTVLMAFNGDERRFIETDKGPYKPMKKADAQPAPANK